MNRNDIDWGGWILTLVAFWIFWPAGVFLLIKQLDKESKKARRRRTVPLNERPGTERSGAASASGPSSGASAAARPAAAKTSSAQRTASGAGGKKTTSSKSKKSAAVKGMQAGKALTIVGGCIAGAFGIALLATLGDIFAYGWYSDYAGELFTLFGFFASGIVCLGLGQQRRKQAKRFRKYLAYIGKNKTVNLASLAAAMGKRERAVYEDLQDMLDSGVLPVGYIDLAAGQLVLSDEGISDAAQEPAPEPEPEIIKTVEDENAILREIREVNDAIPDAVMSAKIDRIGEITGKILDYQRSHPSKSGQLRSFLNYYLPTTLKVLRAYAQLDAQGIEGENISAAKKRIEGMMDQVVDGFEKQLDKLFQDDALDITSDVEVLENMLRQDGLSGGSGMTMTAGWAAAADTSAQQAYLDLQKVAEELNGVTGDDDPQGTAQSI